jgi:hypothetical protein
LVLVLELLELRLLRLRIARGLLLLRVVPTCRSTLIDSAAAAHPAVCQVCQLRQLWQLVPGWHRVESRVEVMCWVRKARPVVLLLLLLLILLL